MKAEKWAGKGKGERGKEKRRECSWLSVEGTSICGIPMQRGQPNDIRTTVINEQKGMGLVVACLFCRFPSIFGLLSELNRPSSCERTCNQRGLDVNLLDKEKSSKTRGQKCYENGYLREHEKGQRE